MNNFKKIYIDKEGERGIDLLENDLIICQKTNAHGSEQLRGVVYQVNDDSIIILEIITGDWTYQDLVRVGNEVDSDRQSFIVLAGEGTGSPYQSFVSGIDSFKKWDAGEGRMMHIGNLDSVRDSHFSSMGGDGIMLKNLYAEGEFIIKNTGENVETLIKANAKGIKLAGEAISLKAGKGDLVSLINMSEEELTIKAEKINIDGLVPSLKAKLITADNIKAKLIGVDKLKADNIDVDSLKSKMLTAENIKARLIGVDKLQAVNIDVEKIVVSQVKGKNNNFVLDKDGNVTARNMIAENIKLEGNVQEGLKVCSCKIVHSQLTTKYISINDYNVCFDFDLGFSPYGSFKAVFPLNPSDGKVIGVVVVGSKPSVLTLESSQGDKIAITGGAMRNNLSISTNVLYKFMFIKSKRIWLPLVPVGTTKNIDIYTKEHGTQIYYFNGGILTGSNF